MPRVEVADAMTGNVVTIPPYASFREAARTLRHYMICGMPVTDDDGRLVGIVTETDLVASQTQTSRARRLRRLREFVADMLGTPSDETVCSVMTREVVVARPTETLREAARRMATENVSRLPVVDDLHRVVGVLSRHDVLGVFERTDEELEQAIVELLERSLDRDAGIDDVGILNGYALGRAGPDASGPEASHARSQTRRVIRQPSGVRARASM